MRYSSHCVEFTGSSYFFQGKLSSLPGSFIFCGLPPPPFPISVPSLFLPVSSQLFKPHHLNLIKQFHWDIALGGAFIQLLTIAADARVCVYFQSHAGSSSSWSLFFGAAVVLLQEAAF